MKTPGSPRRKSARSAAAGLEAAVKHLRDADAVMAAIVGRCGPCPLKARRNYFEILVCSIVSQQISVKAAETISGRLRALAGGKVTPETIGALSAERMREAGISRQKASYLGDLASKWGDGPVDPSRFGKMTDEEIIAALTRIKGIGRWTAEMFLIFCLRRLDVLPVGDLGFRAALKKEYRLRKEPDARRIEAIASKWRPYRSVATWYLWASLGNQPFGS